MSFAPQLLGGEVENPLLTAAGRNTELSRLPRNGPVSHWCTKKENNESNTGEMEGQNPELQNISLKMSSLTTKIIWEMPRNKNIYLHAEKATNISYESYQMSRFIRKKKQKQKLQITKCFIKPIINGFLELKEQ